MARDPEFISKTSDLRDGEVAEVVRALYEYEIKHGEYLAKHFVNQQGFHCFNVNPKRSSDWSHLWGYAKTRFYRRRKGLQFRAEKVVATPTSCPTL